jgi:hypothetical protein
VTIAAGEPLSSRKYCPRPTRQNALKPELHEITERQMMIVPIFARLSTRRQMMLRKSLVLVVSFTSGFWRDARADKRNEEHQTNG